MNRAFLRFLKRGRACKDALVEAQNHETIEEFYKYCLNDHVNWIRWIITHLEMSEEQEFQEKSEKLRNLFSGMLIDKRRELMIAYKNQVYRDLFPRLLTAYKESEQKRVQQRRAQP